MLYINDELGATFQKKFKYRKFLLEIDISDSESNSRLHGYQTIYKLY